MYSERKEITLNNGLVIKSKNGEFPPLQEVAEIEHACAICPVRLLCDDNNEFDCQVYGMFDGFYFGLDDALTFIEKWTEFFL